MTVYLFLRFLFLGLIFLPIANANCDDYLIPPALTHSGSTDCPSDDETSSNDETSEELVFNGNPMKNDGIYDLCYILRAIENKSDKKVPSPLSSEELYFISICSDKPKDFPQKLWDAFWRGLRVVAGDAAKEESYLPESNSHSLDTSSSYKSSYPKEPTQPEHSILKSLFDKKFITLEQLRRWGVVD